MLNFNNILVSSEDPSKFKEFYTKVFEKKPDMDMEGYFGWLIGKGFISFGIHDKIKGKSREPSRILFNFETEEVKEEFARIKEIGAEVIAEPYSMGDEESWIATLADPDGNYFQLMTPWKE